MRDSSFHRFLLVCVLLPLVGCGSEDAAADCPAIDRVVAALGEPLDRVIGIGQASDSGFNCMYQRVVGDEDVPYRVQVLADSSKWYSTGENSPTLRPDLDAVVLEFDNDNMCTLEKPGAYFVNVVDLENSGFDPCEAAERIRAALLSDLE